MKIVPLVLGMLILSIGCHYDVEEDLVVRSDCDTTEVSYSRDILPIIEGRCYKCHAASLNLGGITLEGYGRLIIQINSGRLIGAVRRESGFSPMPQNENMLNECNIKMLEAWIDNGAPDN